MPDHDAAKDSVGRAIQNLTDFVHITAEDLRGADLAHFRVS